VSDLVLSQEDRKAVTGYTRYSAQLRWLRRNGWRVTVNGLGEPVVAVAEMRRHLVGGSGQRSQEPDYGAINGPAA
jgi:Domain of unknown function (DUF4224)